MPPDSYKVEVIHLLNPHLIWIEVRDSSVLKDEFMFEQVGLYGLLPVEKTLDINTEVLKSQKCDEWLPAAAAVMKTVLEEKSEIWFSPTYIDRRTSIFDDNIHKYGELIIITETGKKRKLSKQLLKSGFAYYDICEFHEKLSLGKLKTKLTATKTQEVIKELENFYTKEDRPKDWKKTVDKQTTVFHLSQDFESSLTVSNLERHNNQMISKTLQNKFKDFELCKDVDEQSLGRAYRKTKQGSNDDSGSKLLKKKLSIAQVKSTKTDNLNTTFDDIRNFLDTTLTVESSSNITNDSKSISENNACSETDDIKKENKENLLTRKLKHTTTTDKGCKSASESVDGNSFLKKHVEIGNNAKIDQNKHAINDIIKNTNISGGNNLQEDEEKSFNFSSKHIKQSEISDLDISTPKRTPKKDYKPNFRKKTIEKFKDDLFAEQSKGPKKTVKAHNKDKITQIAYGPPGLNPQQMNIQIMTVENYEKLNEELFVEKEADFQKRDFMFGEVDSDVGIEITNKNTLKDYLKQANTACNKHNDEKIIKKETVSKTIEEINLSDDSIEKKSSSSSLLLERKLKYHSSSLKHDSTLSTSDTSNKDTSSDAEPLKKTSDDDDIEDVMERLNVKYKDDLKKKEECKPTDDSLIVTKLKNNVNPFKNIDPSISVFVDKLVTPVLMVHSKHDRRIQPVIELRDIYFNAHIHNILKNMSVEHPMMLQTVSWFTILKGYSLFMISPMGSGKTLGYLPAVCRLISDCDTVAVDSVGPVCVIVCATAKSVAAVEKMARMFLERKGRVLACYAGVDNLYITTSLLNGCDLLICTPAALARLLQITDFGVDLRRLTTFVLDDCERLATVYGDEIKFFQHKIREMLKTRADKILKVQYVLASRMWCDFMEPLAKKVPDTVVCIGAFQECVLYSKANTSVSLVKSENKIDFVSEFLKEINVSKKTVIVCQSNEEVALLEKALKRSKHVVFACDNSMTIHDLYNLSVSWADYEDPLTGPILVCCDGNLMHMNITDAHHLFHYSLPPLFSKFCKRFSVLNDNYPSIFKSDSESVKIKVLLEESNVEQLPKVLNFIRRCTDNVPEFLDEICANTLAQKDAIKAEKLYPICDSLMTLGYCPDFYNCQERHTILKEYDTPKDWLPKEGVVTCKIIYYHSATLYSARIKSCTINGTTKNYPQTYSKISIKMGMYYSKDDKKLHGTPEVGDICATSIKLNFYVRCQVLKILSRYPRGNPNKVLVKLIDEERYEVTRDIYLYHLPEDLKSIESRVVQLRLANIEPKDKDITFSDLARDHLKKITDTDEELFVKGNIALTIGNCIFVNTLEACQDLTSLNEEVVKHNLKHELLKNHAIPNPEHLPKLEKLCIECGLLSKQEVKLPEPQMPIKNLPRGTWAHLDSDSPSCVFFASAVTPDKFFVRLEKFESCMMTLLKDIKNYVDANPKGCGNVKEGEIVLAKFPDDSTYERARIDGIKEENAKCFFVDQGDWREVHLNNLLPITEQFINRIPFQAIECRLIGIQPLGDHWTDFSTYWFSDNCHNSNGDIKHLFVKYFTKEPAEFTNGHKYSVALIDTSTDRDVIINQLMIDLNLAQEKDSEIKYLDNFETNTIQDKQKESSELGDDWEALSVPSIDCNKDEQVNNNKDHVLSQNSILKPPIRSVPLVNSDNESDDSDKWDINMDNNFKTYCLNVFKDLKNDAVKENTTTSLPKTREGNVKRTEKIELDSDDLTSPDNTFLSTISPEKPLLAELDQKRRPKLVWRQNKGTVTVKIQLVGANAYKLDIEDRVLHFSANVNDTEYGFDLELYGVVDKEKCAHMNKGQYILVKLNKVLGKNWLTLTRDGGIKKWIVYDVDSLDTSSEEEDVVDVSMENVVRNIHNKVESDSDDDEFADDVNSTYKKYN